MRRSNHDSTLRRIGREIRGDAAQQLRGFPREIKRQLGGFGREAFRQINSGWGQEFAGQIFFEIPHRLREVGELVGVRVLDHVIIGKRRRRLLA